MITHTPLSYLSYFAPRVMRHLSDGHTTYAIHDVYFSAEDAVVTLTEDALSPHTETIDQLRQVLQNLLAQGDPIICGDLNYTYDQEDVLAWLESLAHPALDYDLYE